MKLLIVDDDHSTSTVMGELLKMYDEKFGQQKITQAIAVDSLEGALAFLPTHDVVLCDGYFPLRPGDSRILDNWSIVAYRCLNAGVPCVIYSGSADVLEMAALCGVPALAKPTPVEQIYAALFPVSDAAGKAA